MFILSMFLTDCQIAQLEQAGPLLMLLILMATVLFSIMLMIELWHKRKCLMNKLVPEIGLAGGVGFGLGVERHNGFALGTAAAAGQVGNFKAGFDTSFAAETSKQRTGEVVLRRRVR